MTDDRYRLDLDDLNGIVERRTRLAHTFLESWLADQAHLLVNIPGVGALDEAALVLGQALADRDAHRMTRPT